MLLKCREEESYIVFFLQFFLTMDFVDKICQLFEENQWEKVLEIGKDFTLEIRSKFLWAWPTEQSLDFINHNMKYFGIKRILSIGCGSGLLEWLLKEKSGKFITFFFLKNLNYEFKKIFFVIDLLIKGIELDESWWSSSHSPKMFIPVNFINDEELKPKFLRECSYSSIDDSTVLDNNFALLFCYFNNRNAFQNYVDKFEGNVIIIIGPNGKSVFTDPNPFRPNFTYECEDTRKWNLVDSLEIGDSKDFIVIFSRE